MKRRVLVLGATGFVGSACTGRLIELAHEVMGVGRQTVVDLNGRSYKACTFGADEIRRLVADFGPELCVNAAGAGNPAASVGAPAADFEANTILVHHTLEALRHEAPACRYIGVSSAAVYGSNLQLPWTEDAHPNPCSSYGYHKLYSELLAEQYYRLYGLPTLALRTFSVYGPGLRKQLFWDLFRRSRGVNELSLFGTGHETRDYIYIDDVATGIALLADEADFSGKILNLGSGRATTVAQACAGLLHELNWRGIHRFTGDKIPGSPSRMEADMTRTFALGFRPRIDLDEGLQRTVAWLKNTYDDAA